MEGGGPGALKRMVEGGGWPAVQLGPIHKITPRTQMTAKRLSLLCGHEIKTGRTTRPLISVEAAPVCDVEPSIVPKFQVCAILANFEALYRKLHNISPPYLVQGN